MRAATAAAMFELFLLRANFCGFLLFVFFFFKSEGHEITSLFTALTCLAAFLVLRHSQRETK